MGVEGSEGGAEIGFKGFVMIHGKDGLVSGADDSTGALDEVAAKGFDFAEAPSGGALGGGSTSRRVELHLEFASEVVSEDGSEHVELVSDAGSDRDVVHLAMGFEFGEDAFLRPAAFVERPRPCEPGGACW